MNKEFISDEVKSSQRCLKYWYIEFNYINETIKTITDKIYDNLIENIDSFVLQINNNNNVTLLITTDNSKRKLYTKIKKHFPSCKVYSLNRKAINYCSDKELMKMNFILFLNYNKNIYN